MAQYVRYQRGAPLGVVSVRIGDRDNRIPKSGSNSMRRLRSALSALDCQRSVTVAHSSRVQFGRATKDPDLTGLLQGGEAGLGDTMGDVAPLATQARRPNSQAGLQSRTHARAFCFATPLEIDAEAKLRAALFERRPRLAELRGAESSAVVDQIGGIRSVIDLHKRGGHPSNAQPDRF